MARRKLDPAVASEDWRPAVDALADEVARLTALLRSVRDPAAPAVGQWSLAEVAMHLSQAWIVVPGLAADDLSDTYEVLPQLDGTAGASLLKDVWDLRGVTIAGVDSDPERNTNALADRIDQRARAFLQGVDAGTIGASHAWLVEGTSVTTMTLVSHLLNETIVHGYDIARADGQKWPISRSHAALVLDGFVVPVITRLGPPRRRRPGGSRRSARHLRDPLPRGRALPVLLRRRGASHRATGFTGGGLPHLGRPGRISPRCVGPTKPVAGYRPWPDHRVGPKTVARTTFPSVDAQLVARTRGGGEMDVGARERGGRIERGASELHGL